MAAATSAAVTSTTLIRQSMPKACVEQDISPKTGGKAHLKARLSRDLLTDSMTACWSPLTFLPQQGHLNPERRASRGFRTLPQVEQYMSPSL